MGLGDGRPKRSTRHHMMEDGAHPTASTAFGWTLSLVESRPQGWGRRSARFRASRDVKTECGPKKLSMGLTDHSVLGSGL